MRNLLRNKRITLLQALLLVMALMWGCKKEFTIGNAESVPSWRPISVLDARDWFSNRPQTANFGESNEKTIVPIEPAWEKALVGHAQSGKEIVMVPLLRDSLIKKNYDQQANVVMLLSKDSTEVINGELLLYHADSAYYAAHSNNMSLGDFSGEFLFFDLDYNYKYGFVTENGAAVERIDTVTVTSINKGELEERLNPTVDCIAYSELTVYCWTVRECCVFAEVDCITLVETYINCETIGGGAPGGGGGSGGGPGWSGGQGGQGGGPGGSTPPPDFTDILTQNIPVSVFIANGGVLPPGFTEELAKKLQEYYQQNTVTQEEYYYLLANPNVIPLLLDFCTQFPTPPSDGTIQGNTQGEPYDPYQDESNLCNFFRNIVFTCQLDAPQAKWLANSTPDVMQIHAFLNEHQWDAASKQTVQWYTNANAKGTFPNFVEDDDLFPISLAYDYALNYVVYRKECQDDNNGEPCNNLWVCLEAMHRTIGGFIHVGLDICGFFLEPCDAVNGVFYTLEGDFLNASISYISAIPVAGWFSIGGKYAGLFFKTADGVAHSLPYTRTAGNIINFGDRNKLRSVLNIAKNSTNEAHHIIPWEHSGHELTHLAAESKFHMNHSKNGIELPRFRADPGTGTHAYHPQYNDKVKAKMDELWDRLTDYYGTNSVPSSVAKEKLIELEENMVLFRNVCC